MHYVNIKIKTAVQHFHFEQIASTQLYARNQYKHLRPGQWFLYTADMQTEGLGQMGRSWCSPAKSNLYATYSFLVHDKEMRRFVSVPQVVCLQVAGVLESYDINSTIKWANDVLVNRKKISGILVEVFPKAFCSQDSSYSAVLIGVGLNINSADEDLVSVSQPATSMFIETGQNFDVAPILNRLSSRIQNGIEQLFDSGFASFRSGLSAKLEKFDGRLVEFKKSDGSCINGCVQDININGELIFNDRFNFQHVFNNGRIILKPE